VTATFRDTVRQATLRQEAQRQLQAGTAPSMRGWGVSVETLALLHRLASSPDDAGDALKLLHELQVHQVELDLQQAQIESNDRELASSLAHYESLFELAPFPYFLVSLVGKVIESNRAGARLLGVGHDEANGLPLDRFIAPAWRGRFAQLLQRVCEGATETACDVRPDRETGSARHWRIRVCVARDGDAVLVSIAEFDGAPAA